MSEEKPVRITPTDDNVVVELEYAPRQTASGLALPPSKDKRSECGVVVAVGPGKRLEGGVRVPPDLKIGEKVYFPFHAGTDLKSGDTMYRFLRARDILISVG